MTALAYDHRLGPLAPDIERCPWWGPAPIGAPLRPEFQRRFVRAYGFELATNPRPPPLLEWEAQNRPGYSSERIRWFEHTAFTDPFVTAGFNLNQIQVFELVRAMSPHTSLLTIERLATYLRAQALTDTGQPVGDPFVTSPNTDPLAVVAHPETTTELRVRWRFLVQREDPNEPRPPPLVNASFGELPIDGLNVGQLPRDWNDFRYSWGSRFADSHQAVYSSGSLARLFLIVNGETDRWSLRAGGILGGYTQPGGREHAAWTSATRRS